MLRSLLFAAALFCCSLLHAQQGSLSGKIADSTGKKVLPLTTVTVFRAKDTAIITYRLSTETGEFRVPGLPLNVPLRVMATYSGFDAYRKDVMLTTENPALNLGTLQLQPTAKQLDEVIVTSERPPVVIKQDTIEFNASAFKTLPNALVEDMLKKLPGVLVDADGNITVNGQKVNRILVDGKRFFGDDPKMATRNLPSNFIDKVQVVDDKEEIKRNTDGDLSNIGKVINLTLKKGVKKGWFGKMYGGGGTDGRYEAGGIANIFRDTLQLSMLAYSNNVNRSSFSFRDITQLGGFDRSGVSSISISSGAGREGVSVNGINFGGMGSGITTTTGAGFNLNHAPSKKLAFYAQYFYGRTRSDVSNENNTARYFGDSIINSRTNQLSTNIGNSHQGSASIDWNIDSLTQFGFHLGFNHDDRNIDAPSTLVTSSSKGTLINTGAGVLYSRAVNNVFNQNANLSRQFKKKGRNLYISESLEFIDNPNNNTTESLNSYYSAGPSPVIMPFNQLRSSKSPSTSLWITENYTDPLSKTVTIRFNNRFNYLKQSNDIFTYGKYIATGQYDSLNNALSNSLAREQTRLTSELVFAYRIKKITLNFGGSVLQQWVNNGFGVNTSANSNNYYINLLPSFRATWNRFSLSLSQDVSVPNVRYLVPVADNSNPFSVIYGNPSLQPTRNTNMYFNGSIANVKTNFNMNMNANATFTNNAIIQSLVINSAGIQTTTPVNANGIVYMGGSVRLSRQFKNQQKFFITTDLTVGGSYSRAPLLYNNVESKTTNITFNPSVGINMNWHDVVEINPRYFPNFSKSTYTNPLFTPINVVTHSLMSDFVVRAPKKIIWESSVSYRFNSQVAPGLPKENIYWYAAVSMLMLKDDKGQLKLACYDILNRNNGYYRYLNTNAIIDNRTNVLQRYISLSFIYNVRPTGKPKEKVGGRMSLFNF